MRTVIGAMAALALASTAARAADVYGGPAAYAPYVYRWTGPYVGGNLGYQWGALSNSGARPSGITGGAQGGYNWQFGPLVVGAEADLQFSNANDTFANYKFSNPWFGTARGRAGYAMNNIFYYGTLGLAYGRGHEAVACSADSSVTTGSTDRGSSASRAMRTGQTSAAARPRFVRAAAHAQPRMIF
jgi:outer membrane immunogenic protein